MMLGIIRGDSLDRTGAAEAFRRLLEHDPKVAESHAAPVKLRKLFARTFLGVGRPAEARPHLQSILAGGPDPEASWLLSRVCLQQGAIAEAQVAGKTGTAELGPRPGEEDAEHPQQRKDAWFAAFAPAEKAKLAVGVLLIEAEAAGGEVAAPAAAQVLSAGL